MPNGSAAETLAPVGGGPPLLVSPGDPVGRRYQPPQQPVLDRPTIAPPATPIDLTELTGTTRPSTATSFEETFSATATPPDRGSATEITLPERTESAAGENRTSATTDLVPATTGAASLAPAATSPPAFPPPGPTDPTTSTPPEPRSAAPLTDASAVLLAQQPTDAGPPPREASPSAETASAETASPAASDGGAERGEASHESGHPEAKTEDERPPFDPIKENGPIFVDWPDPSLALVITGNQNGYLEPCGCAGLDRMKGGLSRRLTMMKELRAWGWPTVGLDVGGLCKSFGRQAELKFQTTVLALEEMEYKAVTLGTHDLKFPANELLSFTANMPDNPTPFLSANAAIYGFDVMVTEDPPTPLTQTHRIIEEGGWKIGVTGVLGNEARTAELKNPEIETADPVAQLQPIVKELLAAKCDCLVLLAHATMDESKALAAAFPDFNIVVTSGGGYEPPAQPEVVNDGRTILVEVGEKGMNCVVLGLYQEPRRAVRYQRVPLDSRFEGSPIAKLLMQDYQDQLKADGFEKLGIRPSPHPKAATNGAFVGSKKCETCHEPSYDVWKRSAHARAWHTLQTVAPPRTHDPECVSCHVIGWHPTNYLPYQTGYWSEETTPELVNVGCEDCHGPGENHCKAEAGNDEAYREAMREAMVITVEQSKKEQCASCHDGDNSPSFDFDTYWPKIIHEESIDLE